jgi:hypothetical protein
LENGEVLLPSKKTLPFRPHPILILALLFRHLGDNTVAALPTSRGFDSSLGFWSGGQDYFTHWDVNSGGYDMMENETIRPDLNNTWTTEIFAKHAVDTISRFSPDSDERLYLYLAFQNVHWPLMAPDNYVQRFANTTGNNAARQLVCAMAAFLDDAIANVTAALKKAGIYDDSIIIFSSDNGGPTHGDEGTESNNYPLRGGKNTLFEVSPPRASPCLFTARAFVH